MAPHYDALCKDVVGCHSCLFKCRTLPAAYLVCTSNDSQRSSAQEAYDANYAIYLLGIGRLFQIGAVFCEAHSAALELNRE